MKTTFVAVFPGTFLYALDCLTILKRWKEKEKENYIIDILKSENWKEQKFSFGFTESFTNRAYRGFKTKGEEEFKRAELIRYIFTQQYSVKLYSNGILQLDIDIPDDWGIERIELAKTEIEFQFYHVAKSLYNIIQEVENMEHMEFKKFFTYLGEDGIEGLSRKFVIELKKYFEESFTEDRSRLEIFKEYIGKLSLFPFRVLGTRKSKAFKILMDHYFTFTRLSKSYLQREFANLFERLYSTEKSMIRPLGTVREGIKIYEKIEIGLLNIKDMFSFQLGVSSTFFEVIGLTITLTTILLTIVPTTLSGPFALFLIALYIYEILSLLKYSTGPSIEKELNDLILELRRN